MKAERSESAILNEESASSRRFLIKRLLELNSKVKIFYQKMNAPNQLNLHFRVNVIKTEN